MWIQHSVFRVLWIDALIPFPVADSMKCKNCDSETHAEHHVCAGCGGEWCSHCKNVADGGCNGCGKMFCRFCLDGELKCKDCLRQAQV